MFPHFKTHSVSHHGLSTADSQAMAVGQIFPGAFLLSTSHLEMWSVTVILTGSILCKFNDALHWQYCATVTVTVTV